MTINSNDLNTLGVVTLMIITVWLVFSIRRENRTIVALLRDIRLETDFDGIGKFKYENEWDMANLAFQGIANNLVFVNVTENDFPMSSEEIFSPISFENPERKNSVQDRLTNWLIRKVLRNIFTLLLYLPPIIITVITVTDIWSLSSNTAFAEGFKRIMNPDNFYVIIQSLAVNWVIGGICLVLTLANCIVSVSLNNKTRDALISFGDKLREIPLKPSIVTREQKKS